MKQKTIGTIAVALALAAVLVMPVLASAGLDSDSGGNGGGSGTRATANTSSQSSVRRAAAETKRAARRAAAEAKRSGLRANAAKGQPLPQLRKRIANKLTARDHRFDAVSKNLTSRINRIASLAATVAAAGGDVSGVNAKLDDARQHLQNALALENDTIAAFNAIPDAADRSARRAAFFAARAKGRTAVAELKAARVAIRDAAAALRAVVVTLQSESAADGQ